VMFHLALHPQGKPEAMTSSRPHLARSALVVQQFTNGEIAPLN
jgi:hypothetical protein